MSLNWLREGTGWGGGGGGGGWLVEVVEGRVINLISL